MSIRLDPRRLGTLKQLAAESNQRPGDLVRHWVEERIDAARGMEPAPGSPDLRSMLEALTARVAALEGAGGVSAPEPVAPEAPEEPAASMNDDKTPTPAAEPAAAKSDPEPRRRGRMTVKAKPSGERVALHDEMIAVIREQGPLTAAELAGAIVLRGRYAPPRSGKPLDAAMVSQRVSNPTYRSRFVRDEGRIGLAD